MESDQDDISSFVDAEAPEEDTTVEALASPLLQQTLRSHGSPDKTAIKSNENTLNIGNATPSTTETKPKESLEAIATREFESAPTPEKAFEAAKTAKTGGEEMEEKSEPKPTETSQSSNKSKEETRSSSPTETAAGEEEEDGGDGEEEKGWPDLTYSDGRVISRRKRSVDEEADYPDEKKSVDMASACKEEGNRNFSAKTYDTAVACYTEALRYLPRGEAHDNQRSIFHCNRAACYIQLENYEEALYDCDRALELNPRYAKALARRMQAMEKLEKLDEACADAKLWAEVEPSAQAMANIDRLQKAITDRDEKLKEEMMGKLKEMGNWVLGKFGLSMDNFKAVKDPATGSYSISFQQ